MFVDRTLRSQPSQLDHVHNAWRIIIADLTLKACKKVVYRGRDDKSMVSNFTSLNPVDIHELGWPAIRAGTYLAGQSRAEAETSGKNGRMLVPLRQFSTGTSKSEAYPLLLPGRLCSLHDQVRRLIASCISSCLVPFLSESGFSSRIIAIFPPTLLSSSAIRLSFLRFYQPPSIPYTRPRLHVP